MPVKNFDEDSEWKNNLRIITQRAVDKYAREQKLSGNPVSRDEWNAAFSFLMSELAECMMPDGVVTLDYLHDQTVHMTSLENTASLMKHFQEILEHLGHEELLQHIQPVAVRFS